MRRILSSWGVPAALALCALAAAPVSAMTTTAAASGVRERSGAPLDLLAADAGPLQHPEIRTYSLSAAPSVLAAPAPAGSGDPRAAELARALRERVAAIRLRPKAAAAVALSDEQRAGLRMLRDRTGQQVRVRLRPKARTPRQIHGGILERAAAAIRAGEDRSEKTARRFLRANRALLRLDDPDVELSLRRRERDDLGRTHLRFQQRHRGLEVWPAELIVHLDPRGDVDLMDGVYVPTPRDLATEPSIDAATAILRARERVPDAEAAVIPAPELFIYGPGDRPSRLAWKVDVPASLTSRWLVVVDAVSGAILTAYNDVRTANRVGSGVDLFSQTQPLNVWFESGIYYMVDTSKTDMYDPTSNPPQPDQTRGAISILDAQNQPPTSTVEQIPDVFHVISTSASGPWLADAVSATTNFSAVYDYFLSVHSRNSLDGAGSSILAIVRLGENYLNAFFLHDSNLMGFGDAEPFAGALDVVAHELTHGVTFHTANLIYENQPGALNEAFSDIFGEMVEAQESIGGLPDWLIGSNLSSPFRNMQDPASIIIGSLGIPYPSKFSQFISASFDNGGVHLNSSIINHAFYQLAAGLPGAIGISDAREIFFRALTLHLVANSQFIDARLSCIQSAEEIFGPSSTQAQKTAEAFDFVEIFDGAGTPDPSPFPGTQGQDATLFLFVDPGGLCINTGTPQSGFCLGRRELGLGDPALGTSISTFDVKPARPSVAGDGSFAVFADTLDDICLILTDPLSDPDPDGVAEDCLLFQGLISSVAMSPDGNVFGFVFLDLLGQRDNRINVIDLGTGDIQTFELGAPALDGGDVANIRFADVMDFTADGRFIVYDALNVISLGGGPQVEAWSIYAIDRTTRETFTIVPATPSLDIGFPSLSQRSDNFVVFDSFDPSSGQSTIVALDLNTGESQAVGTTQGFGVPSYNGDDTAITFSLNDSSPTGFSLWKQPLAADHITPVGGRALWLQDSDLGAIYRRGVWVPEPAPLLLQIAAIASLALLARLRVRKTGPSP